MNTVIKNPLLFGTSVATTTISETQMENEITTEIVLTNLNDTYVIVKRYDGAVYFKRVGLVTDIKSYPKKNCLYYTKLEADTECTKLNSSRKKCKYVVENASKYFVNMYTYNQWYGANVKITNYAVAIKDFQAGNINRGDFKTLEEAIIEAKTQLNKAIDERKGRQKQKIANLPIELERVTSRTNEEIADIQETVTQFESKLAALTCKNLDDYKSYETQGDKMTRLLYGKSTPTNKSTTDTNTGIG